MKPKPYRISLDQVMQTAEKKTSRIQRKTNSNTYSRYPQARRASTHHRNIKRKRMERKTKKTKKHICNFKKRMNLENVLETICKETDNRFSRQHNIPNRRDFHIPEKLLLRPEKVLHKLKIKPTQKEYPSLYRFTTNYMYIKERELEESERLESNYKWHTEPKKRWGKILYNSLCGGIIGSTLGPRLAGIAISGSLLGTGTIIGEYCKKPIQSRDHNFTLWGFLIGGLISAISGNTPETWLPADPAIHVYVGASIGSIVGVITDVANANSDYKEIQQQFEKEKEKIQMNYQHDLEREKRSCRRATEINLKN